MKPLQSFELLTQFHIDIKSLPIALQEDLEKLKKHAALLDQYPEEVPLKNHIYTLDETISDRLTDMHQGQLAHNELTVPSKVTNTRTDVQILQQALVQKQHIIREHELRALGFQSALGWDTVIAGQFRLKRISLISLLYRIEKL